MRTKMKKMQPVGLFALVMTAAILGGLLITSSTASGSEGEEPAGQAIFLAQKCNMCHAVPAAGIEAKTQSASMKGADLGGKIEADFEQLAAYVRKAGELEGKTHKKEFKGTDEELQAIVDWLGSLEAPE